jgi:periplasmic protein CpxP/Spy
MKTKRISLIAALIAGVLVAYLPMGQAQDANASKDATKPAGRPSGSGGPGGQRAEMAKERLNKMAEELKLTDEQKTKVEAVMKEQQEKMRGAREANANATPEVRREKAKAAREEVSKKMKGILTPEQFAKWEKMPMGRGPGGQGRPGGPGGPASEKKPAEKKAE